jgi:hypothetical protein
MVNRATSRLRASLLLSAIAAALSLCGCASSSPHDDTQADAKGDSKSVSTPPVHSAKAQAQAQIGNADVLAAAALKIAAADRDAPRALNVMKQAVATAPERVDLTRLALQFCLQVQGCDAESYESKLRKLDAGNGVVWLGALARAQSRRDAQAEQQILQAMGQAERIDLYWNTLLWRLASAVPPATPVAGAPNLPLTTALNDVTQWLAAAGVPSFKSLSTACAREKATSTPIRDRCRRIARAMQLGDTAFVEGIGLGLAQQLSDAGSPAWTSVQQRIDALAYQTSAAGAIIRSQVERERFSAEMIELLKKLHREQDVTLAILRWAGQPISTPGP